jgi:hypothetical protein
MIVAIPQGPSVTQSWSVSQPILGRVSVPSPSTWSMCACVGGPNCCRLKYEPDSIKLWRDAERMAEMRRLYEQLDQQLADSLALQSVWNGDEARALERTTPPKNEDR